MTSSVHWGERRYGGSMTVQDTSLSRPLRGSLRPRIPGYPGATCESVSLFSCLLIAIEPRWVLVDHKAPNCPIFAHEECSFPATLPPQRWEKRRFGQRHAQFLLRTLRAMGAVTCMRIGTLTCLVRSLGRTASGPCGGERSMPGRRPTTRPSHTRPRVHTVGEVQATSSCG